MAAKIGGSGAIITTLGSGDHVGVTRQIIEAVTIDVNLRDQLLGARDALLIHIQTRDGLHRQSAFVSDPLDHRTGDDDLLQNNALGRAFRGREVCRGISRLQSEASSEQEQACGDPQQNSLQ